MGTLTTLRLNANVSKFSLRNKRVVTVRLQLAGGKVLFVVATPNSSGDYPVFLESLVGVLEGVSSRDPVVLLEDLNTHMSTDRETWRSVIGETAFVI